MKSFALCFLILLKLLPVLNWNCDCTSCSYYTSDCSIISVLDNYEYSQANLTLHIAKLVSALDQYRNSTLIFASCLRFYQAIDQLHLSNNFLPTMKQQCGEFVASYRQPVV